MSGQWIHVHDRMYVMFDKGQHDRYSLNTDHRFHLLAVYVEGPNPPSHVMGWWTEYYGSSNTPVEAKMFGVIPAEHVALDQWAP